MSSGRSKSPPPDQQAVLDRQKVAAWIDAQDRGIAGTLCVEMVKGRPVPDKLIKAIFGGPVSKKVDRGIRFPEQTRQVVRYWHAGMTEEEIRKRMNFRDTAVVREHVAEAERLAGTDDKDKMYEISLFKSQSKVPYETLRPHAPHPIVQKNRKLVERPNPEELLLVHHFASGCSRDEAAKEMGIGVLTVDAMSANLGERLGAKTAVHAVAICMRNGWIA